jgi:hypothetical protein
MIPLLISSCAVSSVIASPIEANNLSIAPSLISPSDMSIIEIRRPSFFWVEVDGAETYELQVDKNTNFSTSSIVVVDGLESSSYTLSTDLSYGKWFWRVRAMNATYSSPFSNAWEFTIVPPRTALSNDILLFLFAGVISIIVLVYLWNISRKTSTKGESRIVSLIMLTSVFLLPFAVHFGLSSINIVAVMWSFWFVYDSIQFNILDSSNLLPALIFSLFQFVFAIEVIRYCWGQSSKRSVIAWGVVSQIPIVIIGVMNWIAPNIIYSGPSPFLIIVAYYLMKKKGPREPTSPWKPT